MRDYKFRGISLRTGEFVYGDYCTIPEPNIIFYNDKGEVDCEPVDPNTVGQYIGSQDKNTTPIYKGDVLKSRSLLAEIIYENSSFCLKWIDDHTGVIRGLGNEPVWNNVNIIFEVIGNIHSNPELLAEGSE